MTNRLAGIVLCFIFTTSLSAQPLSAFVNLQNQVMVWDKGVIRKIDYLPPVSMKIGRSSIPYLDNSRSFKIYHNGAVRNVNIGFTNEYEVSDHLVAFLNARSLNVFDGGKIKNLTGLCTQYFLGDSILLYFDGIHNDYKAYYDGVVHPIEGFLANQPLNDIKVSDNIAAFDNYANQFRIFYHGELISQEDFPVTQFEVGRNTVAYVDANRQFKVFYKGQTLELESFPPESFSVGDNLVAYVSNDGYFKIFYDGKINSIGFFKPRYQVGDYVVAYRDPGGYFRSFYKGEITTLESYFPDNFVVQYNSIAYVNRMNVLRMFSEGEVYDVTTLFQNNNNGSENNWELSYDVLRYRVGLSLFKIFYKGEEY
jgi:hypothetical protein